VYLLDPVASLQIVDQPLDTGIGLVRHVGQEDLKVDAQLLGHCRFPQVLRATGVLVR